MQRAFARTVSIDSANEAVAVALRLPVAALRLVALAGSLPLVTLVVACVHVLLAGARPATSWRFGAWAVHCFFRLTARLLAIRVEVIGSLPPIGSLIVANHQSYLDALALGCIMPATFLAKQEVAHWPLIGFGARVAGVLFVRRDRNRSRAAAAVALLGRLDAGLTIVNFPEGTTSSERLPGRFSPGLFRRIAGSPVAVVPTQISYNNSGAHWVADDSLVPHLLRLAIGAPTVISVRFSRVIDAGHYRDGDALCAACHARVAYPRFQASSTCRCITCRRINLTSRRHTRRFPAVG